MLEDLGCFCFSEWFGCVPFVGVVLSGERSVADAGFAPIGVLADFEELEGLFVGGGVEVEGVRRLWWGGGEVICCVFVHVVLLVAQCVWWREGGVWGMR